MPYTPSGNRAEKELSRDPRVYIGPTTWVFSFRFAPGSKPLPLILPIISATAMVVATSTSGTERFYHCGNWCYMPEPKPSISLILQLYVNRISSIEGLKSSFNFSVWVKKPSSKKHLSSHRTLLFCSDCILLHLLMESSLVSGLRYAMWADVTFPMKCHEKRKNSSFLVFPVLVQWLHNIWMFDEIYYSVLLAKLSSAF